MERNGRQMIEALKTTRPDVSITVIRTADHYSSWDGDGEIDRNIYSCYDHEVKASTIRNGEMLSASAYLGGSWYDVNDKSKDNQNSLNEISGYLPQMIDEALDELDALIADTKVKV